MWEWQDVVGILLNLFFAVLIDNAHNAHDHWQDNDQNDKNNDPYDVAREEDLAYNFLCLKGD